MNDTAKEFQKRRAKTWTTSWPWLLLFAVAGGAGLYIGDLNDQSTTEKWFLGYVCFTFIFASIFRLIYIIRSHYRCPSCGEVPMAGSASFGPGSFGYNSGVNLNPSTCPKCGAKLK